MIVFETIEDLSKAAADEFARQAGVAVEERGRFTVALSGGSTPKKLFTLLASEEYGEKVDWSKVFVFFGDERYVPPTDPLSNEKMARETLLDQVAVPSDQIFPMYREGGAEAAASAYDEQLRKTLGEELTLDLVLLGLGHDGHTASLFPGDPAVHEKERLVVASVADANTRERITLTPPILIKARSVLFLVAGDDKAAAFHRMINGEINLEETPSQAVARFAPHVMYFVDAAVGSRA